MDLDKELANLRRVVQHIKDGGCPGSTKFIDDCRPMQEEALNLLFQHPKDVKSLRKHLKVILNGLHKREPNDVEKCTILKLDEVFSKEKDHEFPFVSISFLLEDCSFSRKLLSEHYTNLLARACIVVETPTTTSPSSYYEAYLCDALKTVLQTMQFMKNNVAEIFQDPDCNELNSLMKIANVSAIILARSKEYSSSVRNMAGIFLGHLLNQDQSDENVLQALLALCGLNSSELKISGSLTQLEGAYRKAEITVEDEQEYIVFLFKGLFSCTRSSVFWHTIEEHDTKTFLHCSYQLILDTLKAQGEFQFHSFRVLKLWWTKVQTATKFSHESVKDILEEKGAFVQSTLKVLYQHWDSPISGVPTITTDIFAIVVALMKKEQNESFLEELLQNFVSLSSSVKGKYNFISILITELGVGSIFGKHIEFLKSLTPLLAINHLCPIISKTYKAIVIQTAKHYKDMWRTTLLPHLVDALLSYDSTTRINASIYWLPIHLKFANNGYELLHEAISNRQMDDKQDQDDHLLALISFSKVARSENLINVTDLDKKMLQKALSSFNDSIRADTFLLICCNNKTSEEITQIEMDMLRSHLGMNMNSDSAVFRQQLVYGIRCISERLRDSAMSFMKKNRKDMKNEANYVDRCEDIFNHILNQCMNSLYPSFTYQRKKTAIDIFSTLLSTFKNCNALPFTKVLYQCDNRAIFFKLLRDSVPEIRSQSLACLVNFYESLSGDKIEEVKTSALSLCNSPRSSDNESGAILLQYLFTACNSNIHNFSRVDEIKKLSAAFKKDALQLKKDILLAAHEFPVHGWMLALNSCIATLSNSPTEVTKLCDILKDVTETTIHTIKFILRMVFGCIQENSDEIANETSVSADFCEITERIKKLSIKGQSTENTDEVLLTEDHEAILAACWLCLLRGGSLLCTIAKIKCMHPHNETLLSDVCKAFVLILTTCRHRGAIEGCFESFLSTCKALFKSKSCEYYKIPEGIIKSICDSLKSQSFGSSNITRRSAGIPLIVEAILVAELSCKKDDLFHSTMKDIIEVSKLVCDLNPQQNDEQFDLPQVHGLYILKHLLRNSQLGSSVLQYCVHVLKIAIKCLSSPIWIARNAATHLFGAVVNRMLGQKNIDGAHIESVENSVSSAEFFHRYSGLEEFMLEEMKLSVTSHMPSNLQLPKPGLYPILTMLSKLTCGDDDIGSIPQGLVDTINTLLSCPVYSVRYLAAKSLVGLIDKRSALSRANDFVQRLGYQDLDNNALHGHLLFVKMVTDQHKLDSTSLAFISVKLYQYWCEREKLHPVPAYVCLQILSNFTHTFEHKDFVQKAKSRILRLTEECSTPQPGSDDYMHILAELVLQLSNANDRANTFKDFLFSTSIPVQRASSKWQHTQATPHGLDEIVISYILKSKVSTSGEPAHILCSCIENYVSKGARSNMALETLMDLGQFAISALSGNCPLSIQCVSLRLLSSVINNILQYSSNHDTEFLNTIIHKWIESVSCRTSNAEASEPLRLSAAQSLDIAGHRVYAHIQKKEKNGLGKLICATLYLLHDEQPDIRKCACQFVAKLCERSIVCQQNIAAKEFLELVFSEITCSIVVFDTIFKKHFKLDAHARTKSNQALLFDKEPFNLYEEPVEIARAIANALMKSGAIRNIGDSYIKNGLSQAIDIINKDMIEEGTKAPVIDRLVHLIYIQTLLYSSATANTAEIRELQHILEMLQRGKLDTVLKREVEAALLMIPTMIQQPDY